MTITIDQIKELLNDGLSYQKAADKLGVSKNVVMGRMSRHMKKYGDFTQIRRIKTKKHQFEHKKNTEGLTILELRNDSCRYMIGEHRYCGKDVKLQSYCEIHAKECYITPQKRWR